MQDDWQAGEPFALDDAGRRWFPFAIRYEADGKTFAASVWALSHQHAELVLDDLKSTGQVAGRIAHEIGE
jgi:hypothetical protein